ncbi:MAG: helix-turn-helix domain-containing protein [Polyangiaceae bacterium]
MKSYGQFCSIARALELLGERWTLLVVRELLCGSRRFGELQRGLPRISRTMLSQRLRELADGGVIVRADGSAGPEYALSPAGQALGPIVMELGAWGQRYLPRRLESAELDIDALVWDMRRRVDIDALPPEPLVVVLELSDLPATRNRRTLLLRRAEVSICVENPGFRDVLVVRADRRTLVGWWRGDLDLRAARRAGLRVDGPRALARRFDELFQRYALAGVGALAKS